MNDRIIDILIDIKDRYGDMIFYNHQKTKNLLHDLAPGMQKERIHISQFLEINGYFQLKYAGHSYPITRSRLVYSYIGTYAVNEAVAEWVVDVFGELLGYSDFKDVDKMIRQEESRQEEGRQEEGRPEKTNKERPNEEKANEKPSKEQTKEPKAKNPSQQAASTAQNKTPPQQKMGVKGASPLAGIGAGPQGLGLGLKPLDFKNRIAADMHSIAVMADGTVKAVGPNDDGQCDVSEWRDIKAVAAGPGYSVGLKEDGRVVTAGRNNFGQRKVVWWRDIVAISAGARHILGLRADGIVVATGQNRNGECNIRSWRNIVGVSAGYLCTFGIKKDYRVLMKGNIKGSKLEVSGLTAVQDIVNPYPYRAVALKRNGRLLALRQSGGNDEAADMLQRSLDRWQDVKQLSAGPDYFAGLFADGTVRVLAYYWVASGIECNPDDWVDMVAIAAGRFHLIGVRKDGSMTAVMMHPSKTMNKGQCKVRDWRLK